MTNEEHPSEDIRDFNASDCMSMNNEDDNCQPVIPAIHLAKLPTCFVCCGEGHHGWQCRLRGPAFIDEMTRRRIKQINHLYGNEPKIPPKPIKLPPLP